jgi:hypothetical protein
MADIVQMFYCFFVREEHRYYIRFLGYEDNKLENNLVEYIIFYFIYTYYLHMIYIALSTNSISSHSYVIHTHNPLPPELCWFTHGISRVTNGYLRPCHPLCSSGVVLHRIKYSSIGGAMQPVIT